MASSIEFYPTHAEAILWAATEKYAELAKEDSLELAAFRGWLIIRNPDIILEPYRRQLDLAGLSADFTARCARGTSNNFQSLTLAVIKKRFDDPSARRFGKGFS